MTGTPWARGRLLGGFDGPRLLFGRMYEDWGVELAVFPPPGARVLCIASAGDTAAALHSAGYEVTAVDVNPVQLTYARERLAGCGTREGTAEAVMRLGRGAAARLLPAWRQRELHRFLTLDDPVEQARRWREELDTAGLRRLMRVALRPGGALALALRPSFAGVVPKRFDEVLRRRLERTVGRHPNARNPWLWRLLAGAEPPGTPEPWAPGVRLVCDDVVNALEQAPRGGYDAVTLSNVLDGPDPDFARRLRTAVRHAVRPGGVVVLRSAREPGPDGPGWAAQDRSALWGVVRAVRLGGAAPDRRIEP
ncbi:BtaA family protein [Streptomyces glomeratus]|uniref:Methyltransferase type 11 domain-containing protein n=1 Tax=Streptomyces glomeratus TaxID=284452 RepID=A0ABP6LZV0_9ACTN|nr:BtaA family protein [Streptomyces glomeratus]MCF1507855.1 BtaA family protein [Streptomyces glomeratus]